MPQYQGVWTLPVAARLQSTQQWATDPLYRNTTLLLQADNAANGAQNNTFLDSSSNNFTITRNGNTTQGTFTPFSATGWSNYFVGSSDYLTAPSNTAFALGTGDFTVECWFYLTNTGNKALWGIGDGTTSGGVMFRVETASNRFNFYNTTDILFTGAAIVPFVWYHVAVVRSAGSLSVYLNGSQYGSSVANTTNIAQNIFYIGAAKIGATVPYNPMEGYLSNLRVIKGTAVYTANFNPSTSPLTAITNTSLLTCQSNRFVDNSTNNFTISVAGGTPSVQAFSPFAPQYQYTSSVTGGSGYFDGTGDFLSVPDNAAFSLGSGDFTVEAWIYPTATSSYPTFFAQYNGASNSIFFSLGNGNTNLECYIYGTTNITLTGTSVITLNAWQHVAIVRNGNTFTLYRNGISVATNTTSLTVTDSTALVTIGGADGSPSYPFFGYIFNLRFVKGTAVYTGAFTPPIAPVGTSGPASSYSSTTNVNTTFTSTNTSLLVNFTNAGIVDGTMKNNLETVGNAQVSTSVVKYGTGSMAFDGSGDALVAPPSPNLFIGTGDFTVEAWINPINFSSARAIVSFADTNVFYLNTSGIPTYGIYLVSDTVLGTTAVTANVWSHIAFVRSGTALVCYLNGVLVGSTTTASSIGSATATTSVGQHRSSNYWNGYIDDLRITRGIARYTANFTPPTVALPRQ